MKKTYTDEERKELEITLDAGKAHWEKSEDQLREILGDGTLFVEEMKIEDIKYLIQQLDRRFMQLWYKVTFEQANELVDYSPIKAVLEKKSNVNIKH